MNSTDIPHTDNPGESPQGEEQKKNTDIPQQPTQDNSQSNLHKQEQGSSQQDSPNLSSKAVSGTSQERPSNISSETTRNDSQEDTAAASSEPTQSNSQDNQPEGSQEAEPPSSPAPEVHATSLEEEPQKVSGFTAGSAKKIAAVTAAAIAAILLLVYLGVSMYFRSHFLFHTTINGQDFSRQTVEEARVFFADKAAAYTLKITESNGKTESISGSDINMVWDDNQALDRILKEQHAFTWPLAYFKEKAEEEISFEISYDDSALEKEVHSLDAVTAEPVQPQSAYPEFDGNSYVIKPEVYGTELDSEKLLDKIGQSIAQLDEEIDLQEEGFYKAPEYTAESKELKEVCQKLNQYCKASITYDMDVPVVVDKALISGWLSVDKNFNVTLDEAAVRNWVAEFGKRYDTLGTTRPLTTPTGKATEVSGGTYGWTINEDEEFPALLSSIKNGEILTKAPACLQTAASHSPQDWGGTFLEVDLTTQHMWYLQNGTVVFESDVVTGKNSTITPPGVYTILEKLSPTVLVGNIDPVTKQPEYRSPVSFWMRVTWSGIGFHDATWQPAFGGDVYLWNGSHGCINMPYYSAQELYSMIEVGVPVVIHY